VNSVVGSRRRNSSGCCAGIQGTCPGDSDRDFSRNSAACVHMGGAVFHGCAYGRVYPTPGIDQPRAVGRVARATEHASVGRIERRAALDQCQHVVGGQIMRRVGGMLGTITRADPAVLTNVAGDHALGQAHPAWIGVNVMVGADARQARMLATASRRSARHDTADRADLHRSARCTEGRGHWHGRGASDAGDARLQALRHHENREPGSCEQSIRLRCYAFWVRDVAATAPDGGTGTSSPAIARNRSAAPGASE
jgi:hypothetical protein